MKYFLFYLLPHHRVIVRIYSIHRQLFYHRDRLMELQHVYSLHGSRYIHQVFDDLYCEYFQCALTCELVSLSDGGISKPFLLTANKQKQLKMLSQKCDGDSISYQIRSMYV